MDTVGGRRREDQPDTRWTAVKHVQSPDKAENAKIVLSLAFDECFWMRSLEDDSIDTIARV